MVLVEPLGISTRHADIDGSNEKPLTLGNSIGPNYPLSLEENEASRVIAEQRQR